MAGNHSNLVAARRAKNDEFYTQLTDIEKELRHYRKHFRGKTVLCNCDDPFESNFFKFFVLNFKRLGLKKLIATCYDGSAVADYRNGKAKPYKAVVTTVHDTTEDGDADMEDIRNLFELGENELVELEGNGDFRSEECLALLDEADIVVTNPPFSLFREFVSVLMEHEKHFIIIGNVNAITYKEVFPLLKDNRVWLGYSIHSGDRKFNVPDDYPLEAAGCGIDGDGKKYIRVKGVRWFTNIDHGLRHQPLLLDTMAHNLKFNKKLKKKFEKDYGKQEYPHYDNYDAIEVPFTECIPSDYDGVMGVPITFLDKYNPEQFEILGMSAYVKYNCDIVGIPFLGEADGRPLLNGKNTYARIFIRNKHPEQSKEVQQ